MAYPTYTTPRSIPGAATPTYLTAALASGYVTSQTFTVNSTAGWYEVTSSGTLSSNPLGTSGIFTLVVDYGSGTEEKILCSGVVTIGSNVAITVWTDGTYNGRGWDGTSVSAHVSGTLTNPNVFPVRTAVDDLQFNTATANAMPISGGAFTGNLVVASGLTVSGVLSATSEIDTGNLTVGGNLTVTGTSTNIGNATFSGATTINNNLTVASGLTVSGTVTATGIQITESQVTGLTTDLSNRVLTTTYVTGTVGQITGGGTLASNQTFGLATAGPGSGALGTTSSQTPNITVDAYGRVISVANNSIAIAESQVTNLTTDLASKFPYSGGTVSGNLIVASGFTVSGTSTQIGNATFSGATTINNNLTVASGLTVSGNLSISGTSTFATPPNVTGKWSNMIVSNSSTGLSTPVANVSLTVSGYTNYLINFDVQVLNGDSSTGHNVTAFIYQGASNLATKAAYAVANQIVAVHTSYLVTGLTASTAYTFYGETTQGGSSPGTVQGVGLIILGLN
jgi:fibronectin-binding autotransporter adhesin